MTAAGVQRKLAAGSGQVLESQHVICLLRLEETVFGKAQQHAASEVLVSLHHIDIGRFDTRHLIKPARDGAKIGRRIIWSGVRGSGMTIVSPGRRAEKIGRWMRKIPGALG